MLSRLAVIGVVILAVLGCFAYVGGWLSPNRLTPARFTDKFEQVFGLHPGFRRNHAKGVCVTGYFDGDGQAVRLSKAEIFKTGHVPVIGRFSLAGGEPYAADRPSDVRGLGLSFRLPDGEEWRTAMIDLPVFTVQTARGFYDQLAASKPDPATGQPDPARLKAFLDAHPETARAMAIIEGQPFSSGFANATFNSLNAFRFVNAAGISTPVRWSMVPVQPFAPEPASSPSAPDKNYLFDALIAAIDHRPLQWRLIDHSRPAGRSDRRCNAAVAGEPRARRCRNADDRPYPGGSAGQLPRYQFRPSGAPRRDRAVGRSAAQPAIGGLFAVV